MMQKRFIKDDLMLYWNIFLSGNNDGFSKIYDMLIHDLFSFGTTLTSDTELVKDCIQDVFVRLYQNRKRLAPVDNIKVYLLIALKNALINEFKKQQVFQQHMDVYGVEEHKELLDESEEERIIAQESDEAAKNKVAIYTSVLTKRQQEIIHYRFVDELTIEEIAKLLNVNYQSIANTIQRSLKKIRNIYLKNGV